MKFRKATLSTSIATALLFAAAAQAQTATNQSQTTTGSEQTQPGHNVQAADQTKKQKIQQLSTIQVTGFRASLGKSLALQRITDATTSVITADGIGKFPNTNVAEAMVLMPGVTIDRRFGQGDRVSINGTDPNLNLTFLDGHPMPQIDWLTAGSPDRGFDYSILPSGIVGTIQVFKTAEARLPSGSLGGTIIVHTRNPLDLQPNTLSASVGAVYNEQAGKGKPNASVFYSWKNNDSTFGIDVAAAHYGEQINRQGREIFSYSKVSAFASNPNVAAEIAKGTIKPTDLMPAEINAANFQQTRKRNSVLVNLQYKPTDRLDFGLSGLYVKESYNNFNQSMYAFTSATGASSITSLTSNGQGFITGGHSCGVDTPSCTASPVDTELDNGVRFSTVTTTDVHLDGSYNADNWGVNGQIGEGRARDDGREYDISALYFGGYTWSTGQGAVYDSPQAVRNPANWTMNNLSNIISHTPRRNKVRYGTLDFHVDFDSFIQQLLFGIQYENNEHSLNTSAFTAIRPGTYADIGPVSYTDILNNSSFPGFSRDQGQHVQVPSSAVEDWVLGSPFDFSSPNPGSVIRGTWSIAQKTEAAYTQLNFGTGPIRGDVGIRFVKDRLESTYYNPGTFAPTLPPPPSWLQTSHSTYDNVLPSFNLVYDNGGDVLYRLAAAKVIAWAPYPNFLGSTSLNGVTLLGNAGNPELKPYKSYNYSASVEWYFAPQSVLSFTGFYDHIINYISNVVVPDRQFNGLFTTAPALYNSAYLGKIGNCDAKGFCDFAVAQPTSIGGGAIKGFSVAYQQPFGHTGFGILANYTYALGTTHVGFALPYNSKNSISLSPYFEKGPFNARLTYNFRSKYLAGGYSASAEPATVSNYTELDFTTGWAFNNHWSLQLSALNLLNEAYDLYEKTKLEPVDKYTNGRRYMATLQFKWAPPPAAPLPAAAPPPPPPAPAAPPPPQNVVIDLRGVNFKFDRPKKGETNIGPSLKPPASESLAILSQAADTLNRYPQVRVQIDGYTDSVGNPKYNLALSQRRAQVVDQYLISHGVDPSRITAVKGFGEADPVDTNKTAAGRQRNRRVEFKVEQDQGGV